MKGIYKDRLIDGFWVKEPEFKINEIIWFMGFDDDRPEKYKIVSISSIGEYGLKPIGEGVSHGIHSVGKMSHFQNGKEYPYHLEDAESGEVYNSLPLKVHTDISKILIKGYKKGQQQAIETKGKYGIIAVSKIE